MRHYYEKRKYIFYIQKHSTFLTTRRAQNGFKVRRRGPRRGARLTRHMESRLVPSKSHASVRGKCNKQFIFLHHEIRMCAFVRVKHW